MTGNCGSKFQNKNEFVIDDVDVSKIDITGTSKEFTISHKGTTNDTPIPVNFSENTQYVFSGYYSSTKANGSIKITYTDNTYENIFGIFDNSSVNKTHFSYISNTSKSIAKAEFRIFGDSSNFTLYDFQVEKGSTDSDFITHAEQNAPLSLGNIEAYEGDEIQIDYVQKAGYKKVTGARFVKNNAKIASYNGETITAEYKSTTGQLTTGATVVYKLATPDITEITDPTFLAQLETLINMKTYKEVTNIDLTGEDLAPVLDCDYYQDMSTLNDKLIDDIGNIGQLLDILNRTEV